MSDDVPRPEIRGAEQPPGELRCEFCVNTAIECPKGYAVMNLLCTVCSHRMAWVQPDCITEEPRCTRCGGSCELQDFDDEED